MLREVPHKIFHDYAIVFRVMLDENWERKISMAVRNELMEEWGVSVEELWNEAYNNMLRNCPANIFTLEEETESNRDEILDYTPENGAMHVLTNTMTFLGAGAILYEGILEQIGSRLKSDYYLLPSSLHEWVIVPKRFGDFPMMQGMVEKVNTSDVKDEEILGTKVYFYDNEQKKLIVDPEE